jgi:phenylalanyl-tRNA synthetase alpha chain
MQKLLYLTDSYRKKLETEIQKIVRKGSVWHIFLKDTIIYPEGGGQPSDLGIINGKTGKARVLKAIFTSEGVLHECQVEGVIKAGDRVTIYLDWKRRYLNMRLHSAGHILHEAVATLFPQLVPVSANHSENNTLIRYRGEIPIGKAGEIERIANGIVDSNVSITSAFVTYDQLVQQASFVPVHLPKNKPLRIIQVQGFQPIPDGGTQVALTGETGLISIPKIVNHDGLVDVYYSIEKQTTAVIPDILEASPYSVSDLTAELIQIQTETIDQINNIDLPDFELRQKALGQTSRFSNLAKKIRDIPQKERSQAGIIINEVKNAIETALSHKFTRKHKSQGFFDPTLPGIKPKLGHLHIVSQAIEEITRTFERIGFTRVRHPEADWDYYAFEALNMPPNHPARDEWETFFLSYPGENKKDLTKKMVLTPHTSNGQVREMEKGIFPIKMINIAKCYRRQSDVSHASMFHQFEGLYIDKNVSIAHLKGVIEYFVKSFYGQDRQIRLRPFHFQFTEPSFEIDVTCGICHGQGVRADNEPCRLCKSGWLELGGAGMTHPNVLKAGHVDTSIYNGFAFGWGVERTYMMKSSTNLDDVRILYQNDIRFLEQF